MSLIHDALKKAEMEQKPSQKQGVPPPNPVVPGQSIPTSRIILYVALLAVAVGVWITMKSLKKSPATPEPIQALPLQNVGETPIQLKAKALELFHDNKLEEAKGVLEKLTVLLSTDPEVYNNYGMVLKKTGQKEKAYEAYKQALALNEKYPEASNNIGILYFGDKLLDKAKEHFQKAIDFNPNYADPHFNLALVFEQEGNTKLASQFYRQYLELVPEIDGELKKKILAKISRLGTQ